MTQPLVAIGTALAANSAVILSVFGGSAYIAACEFRSTTANQCENRWIGGLAMMGVGGAYSVGFNTLNPKLDPARKKEEQGEGLAEDAINAAIRIGADHLSRGR